MREILISPASVALSIGGFLLFLLLVLLDNRAEKRRRQRKQRLQDELQRIYQKGGAQHEVTGS